MTSIDLHVISDLTPEGLSAELRAIKLALALLATKIPPESDPGSVTDSLRSTGDTHATNLANLIDEFLSATRPKAEG